MKRQDWLCGMCLFAVLTCGQAVSESHNSQRQRPTEVTRFAISKKAASALASKMDVLVNHPLLEQLTKTSVEFKKTHQKLSKVITLAKQNGRGPSLTDLILPSVTVIVDDNHRIVVSGLPNSVMLYVKNRFAVAGATTREEMERYLKFFSLKPGDNREYLDGLLFLPLTPETDGAQQVFLVTRNQFFSLQQNEKASSTEPWVRNYLIRNVFGNPLPPK